MMNLQNILFILFFIPGIVFGQLKLLPRNEVYKDSSLTTFVCKLQYAIVKKDKDYLLSVIDKKIKNDFGGVDGIEEFINVWSINDKNSSVWITLSKLISLGGTFINGGEGSYSRFAFPYVFSATLPNNDLDPFSTMIITGSSVNVREKPDKNSKILGKLTYDIVTVDIEKSYSIPEDKNINRVRNYSNKEWYFITTLDKKLSGYVYEDYIWSCVGYRILLEKTDGEWKITHFLEGD